MAFQRTDDEDLIRKTVREFARDHIGLEAASDQDRHDRFPEAPLAAAAGLGLFGLGLPADAGGPGMASLVLALDELSQVDPNTAAILALHNTLGLRLADEATAASGAGGELIAVLATEEALGSDKQTPGTRAVETDGTWHITGQKNWVMGAVGAKHLLIYANTDAGPTWFHAPADADGVVLGRNEAIMGLRASGIRAIYLDDVAATPIGEPGQGLAEYEAALAAHQVATAACINGCVAGAYDAARQFAEDRVQFGKPIGTYQMVSDSVVEIDARLAASRALTERAAAAIETNLDAAAWAARAKLVATEGAIELTRRAIRVQGGTGFMREGGTERFARDVRALQFVAEPSSAQRSVLKRELLDIEFEAGP